jgi:2,3-dihydroxybenzoate decarboxylase
MVKKIAVEEHCMCPGLEDYWAPTVADMPANKREAFLARLTDFGEMRLEAMNKAGIERAVLAVAGPGVQAERDTKTACRKARAANDFLRVKSTSAGTAIPASRILPCRTPSRPRTSSNAQCASSNSAAP